jgi:hypothetical protein
MAQEKKLRELDYKLNEILWLKSTPIKQAQRENGGHG